MIREKVVRSTCYDAAQDVGYVNRFASADLEEVRTTC